MISVRFDRGQLFTGMGLYQAAIEDVNRAVALSPETAEYANALAWLLAACPDAKLQAAFRGFIIAHKPGSCVIPDMVYTSKGVLLNSWCIRVRVNP